MKKFLLLYLILIGSAVTSANDLKKALQGVWLCTQILDKNSEPTSGKFGASDEYLKFSFNLKNSPMLASGVAW